ncbi:helix-turn-helix domain-containing protein [Chryseobacterium sp. MFBS3-17]|uniref:helix-turn-helix domain-containing protein n=1 Tax=Chryseobacterium sp. MFBS3-17 TaxID=2886689 RepID=UPI001D0DC2D4|nr:helix-turn-helix transcriptional regulator [Chryseobacterium sp. MFBS3-17]MCC2589729.1 helix-turn-helix transcriptional regulator [Chryseobacterium sp. MFBS3-17]
MPIIINIDIMLARRKMQSRVLAEKIGITQANLSVLKTGKAKAIKLSTLEAICKVLDCQPGDLLEYLPTESVPDAEY